MDQFKYWGYFMGFFYDQLIMTSSIVMFCMYKFLQSPAILNSTLLVVFINYLITTSSWPSSKVTSDRILCSATFNSVLPPPSVSDSLLSLPLVMQFVGLMAAGISLSNKASMNLSDLYWLHKGTSVSTSTGWLHSLLKALSFNISLS